jgi:glycerol uptake facilitator-like aquaporin
VLATLVLMLTIFMTASHAHARRLTRWSIPPLFGWLVWWEGPWSGASTNPARSVGAARISGQCSQFWIYVRGQHRVQVARLYHFS